MQEENTTQEQVIAEVIERLKFTHDGLSVARPSVDGALLMLGAAIQKLESIHKVDHANVPTIVPF